MMNLARSAVASSTKLTPQVDFSLSFHVWAVSRLAGCVDADLLGKNVDFRLKCSDFLLFSPMLDFAAHVQRGLPRHQRGGISASDQKEHSAERTFHRRFSFYWIFNTAICGAAYCAGEQSQSSFPLILPPFSPAFLQLSSISLFSVAHEGRLVPEPVTMEVDYVRVYTQINPIY